MRWQVVTDDNGREVARPCRSCGSAATARGVDLCGCPLRYQEAFWNTWAPIPQVAEPIAALRSWPTPGTWCALLHAHGKANLGAGKSRVLATLCHEYRAQGGRARYMTVPQLVALEGLRIQRGNDELAAAQWACEFGGLLALDDLGMEHEDRSGWSSSIVEMVTDARYSAQLPTAIATNLDLDGLRDRYPRLHSRAHEGLLIPWTAPDYRRRFQGGDLRVAGGER